MYVEGFHPDFGELTQESPQKVEKIKYNETEVHYLSKDVQSEMIKLLAVAMHAEIISLVHAAKYYSIILDWTPEVSYTEQMTVIVRFVAIMETTSEIQEHFLGFIPLTETAEALPTRLKRKKKQFDYEADYEPLVSPQEHFKVNFHFAVFDTTISSLDERFQQLEEVTFMFRFLYCISKVNAATKKFLMAYCKNLQHFLSNNEEKDIEGHKLCNEVQAIARRVPKNANPENVLNFIITNDLIDCDPNFFRGFTDFADSTYVKSELRDIDMKTKQFIFVRHFVGEPKLEDFELVEEELPPLKDKEILCEALYLSVDPYMRPYSRDRQPGTTMIGSQVAKVIESKHSDYPVGELLVGYFGWRLHTIKNPDVQATGMFDAIFKLPNLGGLSPSVGLGAVGMPGNTAYFGFLEICQPKPGETVVVNGAAGAVGSLVGQIAKIKGCKVIGYAGSDDKIKWLQELGFDHAFNYKKVNIRKSLKEAAPNGVDCYFDNVGGLFSSEVLNHMNTFGRVSVCGAISVYNDDPKNPTL
ncbi:hypothetical protein QYM36_014381, partial [Artemia franciscana]